MMKFLRRIRSNTHAQKCVCGRLRGGEGIKPGSQIIKWEVKICVVCINNLVSLEAAVIMMMKEPAVLCVLTQSFKQRETSVYLVPSPIKKQSKQPQLAPQHTMVKM